ncbi:hypothetical protein B0H11DRAFT_1970085 [Mycena galericulata]|nr:hypothetical protein B0H11DRAFT_1970085 [Mycena galericulata]
MPPQRERSNACPPTASERTELAADRAQISNIDAQILKLKRSLQSLREEKAFIQGRLDAYTYPVLTLPNEIVSEIFIHFLPKYPKRPPVIGLRSPTLLCQICRKWRHIALSTPALWRAIRAIWFSQSRVEKERDLFETSLKLSGSCPLSIALIVTETEDAPQELSTFIETLSTYSARWEHLKLFLPLRTLRFLAGPLPQLRDLSLGCDLPEDFDADPTEAFHEAPLLQTVSLHSYRDAYRAVLPWSQLTTLTVDFMEPGHCAVVLNLAVNLVHCELRIVQSGDIYPSLSTVAPLPYLQSFAISLHTFPLSHPRDPVPGFLDTLTLPALRKLRVAEGFLHPEPVATLVTFLSRSGCTTLDELCITGSKLPRHTYRAAFLSVASLRFAHPPNATSGFFREFLCENDDNNKETRTEDGEESDSCGDVDSEEGGSGSNNESDADEGSEGENYED